jgi:hypothetical protein
MTTEKDMMRRAYIPIYRWISETGEIYWLERELKLDASRSALRQKKLAWLNNKAPKSMKNK